MLEIKLEEVSKRFVREWIIRKCNCTFYSGKSYAITGPNGSGKSSLAQLICGYSTPSSGKISYLLGAEQLTPEDVYKYISYAAPYVDLIEEMTLNEFLSFHFQLKKSVDGRSIDQLLTIYNLEHARDKEIRNFSSGMKQRLKVGLALTTVSELIILDEPTTNMDENGVRWYLEMIASYTTNRLLIICSNQNREYDFCDETLNLMNWK